ncbi:transposase family protein [Streptomyces scabiei]|uniref:transposase family protein n=1 Tax=Streptomyces scabiei TaxID=1930 RepID=UPI001F20E56E|nr:transposase family protein [Streptomyces scabiei]
MLGRIPDVRRSSPVRGHRYRLGSLLALCPVAVLGGATSLAAIARFAVDIDPDLRERIGLVSSTPSASTPERLLARRYGDTLDDAVGAWLARYATDPIGKHDDRWSTLPSTARLRGSRTDGTAVHLLAAALHACQTVIARRQIAERSNAIPADGPLPRHWWTADSSSPRPRAARPRGRRTHPARRLLPWSVAEATGGSTSPSP